MKAEFNKRMLGNLVSSFAIMQIAFKLSPTGKLVAFLTLALVGYASPAPPGPPLPVCAHIMILWFTSIIWSFDFLIYADLLLP